MFIESGYNVQEFAETKKKKKMREISYTFLREKLGVKGLSASTRPLVLSYGIVLCANHIEYCLQLMLSKLFF